ncbi:hypothetical protein SUNI508_02149 [Seiridium unicorne]|uniref:Uncharacterized protein n=1 Tax=Seiridium unicorne TaxID=138068 RepID=A0ABR2ULW1_9PEZI
MQNMVPAVTCIKKLCVGLSARGWSMWPRRQNQWTEYDRGWELLPLDGDVSVDASHGILTVRAQSSSLDVKEGSEDNEIEKGEPSKIALMGSRSQPSIHLSQWRPDHAGSPGPEVRILSGTGCRD